MTHAPFVDGMISHLGVDPGLLEGSRLDAAVVTAADWHADFDEVCRSLAKWIQAFAATPEQWFAILGPTDVDAIGDQSGVGLVLALQNSDIIEDRPERVLILHRLGVRILQPSYNTATLIADGCLEDRDAGISCFGRRFVSECNRLGIGIDLSHVGNRSALDIADASEVPVVVTHANRRRAVDNPRNKSDDLLVAVAGRGGVIGATAYAPMCWGGEDQVPGFEEFAHQVATLLELVGEDAVAIGTDHHISGPAEHENLAMVLKRTAARYGGIVGPYVARFGNDLDERYVDGFRLSSDWALVGERLRQTLGLDEAALNKILGGNWMRVLRTVLVGALEPASEPAVGSSQQYAQ